MKDLSRAAKLAIALRKLAIPGAGKDRFYVLPPFEQKIQHFTPGALAGIDEAARFQTNSDGIRAREFSPQDRYRVLALGCSMTICQYIDQEKTWPAVMEACLEASTNQQVWVGAIGKSTFTTRDILTVMQYFVPQIKAEIDMLVILIGVNDLALILSKRDEFDPGYLDRSGIQHQLTRAFDQVPGKFSNEPTYKKSRLWRTASSAKRILRPAHWYRVEEDFLPLQKRRKNASGYVSEVPDLSVGLNEFEQNIHRTIDITKGLNLRLVFLTVPSLWKAEMADSERDRIWFGWISGSSQYYTPEVLACGISLYNERLKSVCKEHGIPCLDSASAIDKGLGNFYDDVHFSNTGCRNLAEYICNNLIQGSIL